jgi:hypothetical protein
LSLRWRFLTLDSTACADYQRIGENGESSSVDEVGFRARTRRKGKASHGGHRGGFGMGGQNSTGGSVGVCARNRCNRKHRTEATEGDGVGGSKFYRCSVDVCARNQVQQKSIAQRPQKGIWGGWPKFYRCIVGVCARNQVQQKASHRGHRGGIGVGSQKFYRRQRGRPGEKSSLRGRHRTEVAKGDLVRWSKILSATAWASGRELIERNGQSIVESCSGTRSMRKCKSPHRKKRQLGA